MEHPLKCGEIEVQVGQVWKFHGWSKPRTVTSVRPSSNGNNIAIFDADDVGYCMINSQDWAFIADAPECPLKCGEIELRIGQVWKHAHTTPLLTIRELLPWGPIMDGDEQGRVWRNMLIFPIDWKLVTDVFAVGDTVEVVASVAELRAMCIPHEDACAMVEARQKVIRINSKSATLETTWAVDFTGLRRIPAEQIEREQKALDVAETAAGIHATPVERPLAVGDTVEVADGAPGSYIGKRGVIHGIVGDCHSIDFGDGRGLFSYNARELHRIPTRHPFAVGDTVEVVASIDELATVNIFSAAASLTGQRGIVVTVNARRIQVTVGGVWSGTWSFKPEHIRRVPAEQIKREQKALDHIGAVKAARGAAREIKQRLTGEAALPTWAPGQVWHDPEGAALPFGLVTDGGRCMWFASLDIRVRGEWDPIQTASSHTACIRARCTLVTDPTLLAAIMAKAPAEVRAEYERLTGAVDCGRTRSSEPQPQTPPPVDVRAELDAIIRNVPEGLDPRGWRAMVLFYAENFKNTRVPNEYAQVSMIVAVRRLDNYDPNSYKRTYLRACAPDPEPQHYRVYCEGSDEP